MWYRIGIILANIENRIKIVWNSVNLLYGHCLGIDHRKSGAYFVIGNNTRNLEYLIRISAFSSIRAMKYFRIQTVINLVLTGVLCSENVQYSDKCAYRVCLTSQGLLLYGTICIVQIFGTAYLTRGSAFRKFLWAKEKKNRTRQAMYAQSQ
jgi:hypothetical protein